MLACFLEFGDFGPAPDLDPFGVSTAHEFVDGGREIGVNQVLSLAVNFDGGVEDRAGAAHVTPCAFNFGHGIQHARRALWILVLLLVISGSGVSRQGIPLWLSGLVGLCLAVGTLLGGWRISYTLSTRVVTLDAFS